MIAADPSPGATDYQWPKQSWFLRGPLLSTIIMIAAVAALITEFVVMLISGEGLIGYLGLLLSASGLLTIFRARWVGLLLTLAGGVVSALFATEFIGIWTVTVFAMFLFARQGRHVLPAMAVTAAGLYLALVHREENNLNAPIALVAATFCVAAAAAGSAVRLQTEAWDAARQRALDIAATKAIELRQAVTEERLRIARDLHDVVGHELAVVNINVGVAEVSLPADVTSALRALNSARGGLQRTLLETQQILDLLRETGAEDSNRTELALVEHIPSLVARIVSAGSVVESQLDGDLPELDVDVSSAAYRIVQEALTNAAKYGVGGSSLAITTNHDRLIIDVQNRPASTANSDSTERPGYGLVGMTERTQSTGGTIEISQTDEVFHVHVELPTKGGPSDSGLDR